VSDIDRDALAVALELVLAHTAGFAVTLFADLWISCKEDGRFYVWRENTSIVEPGNFDNVHDAVKFFLDWRERLQLGIDFEGPS
jgi:hypothetical protein